MTSHLSERFHDDERHDVYLDLIQSATDRLISSDQAWILDRVASTIPAPVRPRRRFPRLSLRWFALPVPLLTWARS